MIPEDIIRILNMRPHPEGGHYVETFRDAPGPDGRARSTAIYFLLRAGERSHWHRVDVVEMWLWHAGAPLALELSMDGKTRRELILGPDLATQRPQIILNPREWQAARSLGDWTLVSCVVAPGFDFAGFELAPPGWAPEAPR
ncbi:MAG: cupin domain-containing protein [Hyphomonadaceae bacterium]|nr:cupin domain-containing protein [Hyphomonadaceae bacterium]